MNHLKSAKAQANMYDKRGYEDFESWIPVIAHFLISIAEELNKTNHLLKKIIGRDKSPNVWVGENKF